MMNDKQLAAEVESQAIRLEHMRDALTDIGKLLDGHDQIGEAILLVKSALGADTTAALSGLDHNGLRLRIGGIHLKISEEHAGKGPVPILVKHAGDQSPNLWSTADGSSVYRDREWAERADYMKTEEYAQERDRLCAARRLVRATVEEGYDGWVTTDGNEDEYAASTDELLERLRDRMWGDVPEDEIASHLPAWAHCCTEQDFDFDIEDAISSYLDDNHHEDAIDWIKDWEGLTSFWADWRAKQKDLRSNLIDYTRIVVIDRPRYEAELAAAKAYLETAE